MLCTVLTINDKNYSDGETSNKEEDAEEPVHAHVGSSDLFTY